MSRAKNQRSMDAESLADAAKGIDSNKNGINIGNENLAGRQTRSMSVINRANGKF